MHCYENCHEVHGQCEQRRSHHCGLDLYAHQAHVILVWYVRLRHVLLLAGCLQL
jgi:hypothetical protein